MTTLADLTRIYATNEARRRAACEAEQERQRQDERLELVRRTNNLGKVCGALTGFDCRLPNRSLYESSALADLIVWQVEAPWETFFVRTQPRHLTFQVAPVTGESPADWSDSIGGDQWSLDDREALFLEQVAALIVPAAVPQDVLEQAVGEAREAVLA